MAPTIRWGRYGSSSQAMSSPLSRTSSAPAASSKCAALVAPMMGDAAPLAHSHARATCCILTPYRPARVCTRRTISMSWASVRSYLPMAARSVRLRMESEFQVGRVRCPAASGLYGISETFICRQMGISSRSSSRYSRL